MQLDTTLFHFLVQAGRCSMRNDKRLRWRIRVDFKRCKLKILEERGLQNSQRGVGIRSFGQGTDFRECRTLLSNYGASSFMKEKNLADSS